MKKIVSFILVIVLLCTTGTTVFASDVNASSACEYVYPEIQLESIDYEKVTDVIYNYFSQYYKSIENKEESENIYNYIDDNENTRLYLKKLEYSINWRKELDFGIADSYVKLIDVKNVTLTSNDTLNVRAYVKVAYRYLEDATKTMTSIGDLWELELDDSYKIIFLDTDSNDYHYEKELIKENLSKNSGKANYTKINAIDDAFATINGRIPFLKELNDSIIEGVVQEESIEDDQELSLNSENPQTRAVSVSYNKDRAKTYANLKGFDEDTKIFKRMSADCTNFVSQCLWVGYGGDQGNSWYSEPGITNCRNLAYQDYRQIPGSTNWFGRSQISSGTYPSGPWMRVKELYSYLSTSSNGPRASKYNNGSLYSSSGIVLRKGDILQLSTSSSNADYFHSVMVVSGEYSMSSNPGSIYVGQHSSDNGYRQLTELIANNSAPYVRIIRPTTGSFNS